ncbi:MAG: SpoIID/LytB domain-containing protein [Firmicutes bacterium]|nr:SpoIID/LytB domain-containing protein [Bacillota bacterium]
MSLMRETVKKPVFSHQLRLLRGLLLFGLIIISGIQGEVLGNSSTDYDPVTDITGLYYQGRFTQAKFKLVTLVKQDPDNDWARLNLVRVLKENGEHQLALNHLKLLTKKDPENLRYRLVMVETAYLAGKPDLAVEYFYPGEADPQILYWLGLAFAELGKADTAREVLKESIKLQPYNPMANYALGLVEQKMDNMKDAFTRFQQALAQEPNLSRSYFPLAKNYSGAQKQNTANNLLVRAQSTKPWTLPVNHDFQETSEEEMAVLEEQPVKAAVDLSQISLPIVTPITENREAIPEIRIGLASKIQRLKIKTGGSYTLAVKGGSSHRGETGEILIFVRTSKGIEVYGQNGKLILKSWQPLILSYEDFGATSLLFEAKFGSGTYWSKGKTCIYRGVIELIPKKIGLTVVNRVNLEEYLYGVVPAEIPATWPRAVLEAQAVAARTYALANLGRYRIQGFDLLATPASQVYSGVTQEAPAVIEAVNATQGQILTFEGKPAAAFYYDNSGGYTESGAFVWGTDRPYLQALPEQPLIARDKPLAPDELSDWLTSQPDCVTYREGYFVRSAYRWTLWVTRRQLESRIHRKAKVGRIKAIIPMERGISGRVKRVMIKGTAGSYILNRESIPYRLGGLRSTLFVVQPKLGKDGLPESFVFSGGGWGHGVGMSQSGAAGMASDGATASEILSYYYPGTELVNHY